MSVILIVDDSETQLTLMATMLERKGDKIICANSTEGLLDLINIIRPDVILLDLMMPIKCGDEMYKELKNSDYIKGTPVVFITGACKSEFNLKTVEDIEGHNKLDSILYKPFSRDEIQNAVSRRINNEKISGALDRALGSCQSLRNAKKEGN